MLEILKLVKGTISKKDFVPILSHYHIYDGRIQGSNGRVTIDVPCPELEGVEVTVPADKFSKAIEACKKEPEFTITEKNLIIKSGKFRAQMPLANHSDFPKLEQPVDGYTDVATPILPTLKRLKPFVGDDASRMWITCIRAEGGYAYATNNPVIARVPFNYPVEATIPVYCIDELLRMGREPTRVRLTEDSLYFDLGDSCWMRSTTVSQKYPNAARLFESSDFTNTKPVPEELSSIIEEILPFCSDPKMPAIKFSEEAISTRQGETMAQIEGIEFANESYWRADNLLLVLSEATHYDLEPYPDKCPWTGEGIEGLMLGLRL